MSFLKKLKESTSSSHQEIERVSSFKKIISQEITFLEYSHLLHALYKFIFSCEQIIQENFDSLISGREKSPLLFSDLQAINHVDPSFHSILVPIPPLTTKEDVYGYLYVMEGSTLGGQVITKLLSTNTHLPSFVPTNYFNAYGKDTKRKWCEFNELLIKDNLADNQQLQVISTAISTFSNLSKWIRSETR